jgi:signal transduction histidine kinase
MGESPGSGLLIGLVITLAAVVLYSGYVSLQIQRLRQVQSDLLDRDRKDSLQLVRIQNDLNSLGLAMRDMLDSDEPYPLTAWTSQLERIRSDLEDGLRLEDHLAVASRTPEQRQYLASSLAQFWDAVDRMFDLAKQGKQTEARAQIRLSLQARQAALSTAVARLLVENSEREEAAALTTRDIYDRVERQGYVFLGAILLAILCTGLYQIGSNRRLFTRLENLSQQRSDLAQTLISMQESALLHISRELHDEFGQILTAMGAMLSRAGKHAPDGSQLRDDLTEVAEIAQSALDKVRSLSQSLHPVMLEESGLEATVDWYIPVVERQTGIVISYRKSGTPIPLDGRVGVHIYRILQEALNNVARHAQVGEAWVRLSFRAEELELEVEDHGKGFGARSARQGIGLVAMRERAELLGGTIEFLIPEQGGTLVRLRVPLTS